MNKRNVITSLVGLLLLLSTVAALTGWQHERKRADELATQVDELQKQEKRSAVLRSVSSQLEEIANQQRAISDEQRIEAQRQTQLANEERQKALLSELQAKTSEQHARVSEQQAQEARLTAENQQAIAEQQRMQAELSRSIADTLRYQALGRSLGSLSTIQYQSGNTDVANILAYAAYEFTNRFNGDIYHPAVLQALMTASQSTHSWPVHNGVVTSIRFAPHSNSDLASVSNFGELMTHHYEHGQLKSTVVISDSTHDFRDVFIDSLGTIYTISRKGQLVIIPKKGQTRTMLIQGIANPQWLSLVTGSVFAVIGTRGVAFVDTKAFKQQKTHDFGSAITAVGYNHGRPLLFDEQGQMHELISLNKIATQKVPVKGRVTAFANSKNAKLDAYGMSDGTIYIIDQHGNQKKLVGHRSRITRLKLDGQRLYSSGYDGMLNFWVISMDRTVKTDPMPILNAGSWIMNFTSDARKQNTWIADQRGNLTKVSTAVPLMARDVKTRLSRDLTPEEWNFYVGKSVPYESFVQKKKGGDQ